MEHYIWDRQKHGIHGKQHNKMHQFLSGSGGREVHEMSDPPVETKLDDVKLGYLGKTFGFTSVDINNKEMKVVYWDQFGRVLYEFIVNYPK